MVVFHLVQGRVEARWFVKGESKLDVVVLATMAAAFSCGSLKRMFRSLGERSLTFSRTRVGEQVGREPAGASENLFLLWQPYVHG
jgi:hypothetical protein